MVAVHPRRHHCLPLLLTITIIASTIIIPGVVCILQFPSLHFHHLLVHP